MTHPIPFLETKQVDISGVISQQKIADISAIPYAVLTTNHTVKVRVLNEPAFYRIANYLTGVKGLHVVLLGKASTITGDINGKATAIKSDEIEIDYKLLEHPEMLIDLRDETSLMETAAILARSQLVLGVDNGLIHLAASARAPKIVCGFTTVAPVHRVPSNYNDTDFFIVVPPESLTCRFCQSKQILLSDQHDFRFCIKGNLQCVPLLTFDGPGMWKEAIDKALGNGEKTVKEEKQNGA
jgi:hypothetical protein